MPGASPLAEAVTPVDPALDADDAVGGLRFGEAVVDVGAQRVQRHAAFAIPLGARDLDAVQAARAHDLDALRAQAHRVLHRALHRAAEHDPLLELLRDRVGDQLRVDLGLADLLDVDVRPARPGGCAARPCSVLDVLALLADHDARARREDRDARVLRRALDQDARRPRRSSSCFFRYSRTFRSSASIVAKFLLFAYQRDAQLRVTGEAEAGRMDLLSHGIPCRLSCRR